jgi:hypothetical protein
MSVATIDRGVTVGTTADGLAGIAHPATALAIWERPLPPLLRDALAGLDCDRIDDIALDAVDAPLDTVLRAAGYPEAIVTPLAADIGLLLDRHAELTNSYRPTLRLEVETDACRRLRDAAAALHLYRPRHPMASYRNARRDRAGANGRGRTVQGTAAARPATAAPPLAADRGDGPLPADARHRPWA